MSQEDLRPEPKSDPQSDSEGAAPTPAVTEETKKKKRGFWGWLTGRAAESPQDEAREGEPREAEPAPATGDAGPAETPPAVPADTGTLPVEPEPEPQHRGDVAGDGAGEADTAAAPFAAEMVATEAEPAPEVPPMPQPPVPMVSSQPQAPEAPPLPDKVAPAEVAIDVFPLPVSAHPAPAAMPESVPAPVEPAAAPMAAVPHQDESDGAPVAGEAEAKPAAKKSFWARLTSGLARTASSLGQGITDLVSKRKLDAETLEDLEDILIRADLGVETATRIVEAVGKGRHDKMISPEEVKGLIAVEVERILEPVAKPLVVDVLHRPFVVLMVGVNGSGKTTTIGKLAAQWRHEGKKVVLAAGDTFRAAAVDQLKVWGQRTGTKVIAREPGADAAGVAHEAITEARADGADILLIDTAGRLQNRTELMAELEKIVRVVKKLEPSAPHAVLLVLDATVGQNALSQVEVFTRIAGVTGLVMTKLDGTARGGILVAIAAKHRLPVHLIGVGEAADDLQPFTARDFARAIAGLE
nr:signal recognition particle-docking protein FtsY [Xanthobacter agilis]